MTISRNPSWVQTVGDFLSRSGKHVASSLVLKQYADFVSEHVASGAPIERCQVKQLNILSSVSAAAAVLPQLKVYRGKAAYEVPLSAIIGSNWSVQASGGWDEVGFVSSNPVPDLKNLSIIPYESEIQYFNNNGHVIRAAETYGVAPDLRFKRMLLISQLVDADTGYTSDWIPVGECSSSGVGILSELRGRGVGRAFVKAVVLSGDFPSMPYYDAIVIKTLRSAHRDIILDAVSHSLMIPEELLEEYPELVDKIPDRNVIHAKKEVFSSKKDVSFQMKLQSRDSASKLYDIFKKMDAYNGGMSREVVVFDRYLKKVDSFFFDGDGATSFSEVGRFDPSTRKKEHVLSYTCTRAGWDDFFSDFIPCLISTGTGLVGLEDASNDESPAGADFSDLDSMVLDVDVPEYDSSKSASAAAASFSIPEGIKKFYTISGDLSSIGSWQAKVILGNSGKTKGSLMPVSIVLVDLMSSNIIPVSSGDEHNNGIELYYYLLKKKLVPSGQFVPLYMLPSPNYLNNLNVENRKLIYAAAKQWASYGGPQLIFEFDSREGAVRATLDEFLAGGGVLAPLKGKLTSDGSYIVRSLSELSELSKQLISSFRSTGFSSRKDAVYDKYFSYAYRFVKNLLDSYKRYLPLDVMKVCESALNDISSAGEDGFSVIESALFAHNGVKNSFHTAIRKAVSKDADDYDIRNLQKLFGDLDLAKKELDSISYEGSVPAAPAGRKKKAAGVSVTAAPIDAYHGSPTRFEQFSTEKVGTGEGAQSYGWGLYFTDKKEIADYYKKALSENRAIYFVDGVPVDFKALPEVDKDALRIVAQPDLYGKTLDAYRDRDIDPSYIKNVEERVKYYRGRASFSDAPVAGAVYHVKLVPEDSELLLWDASIDSQPFISALFPPNVARSFLNKYAQKTKDTHNYGNFYAQTGQMLYHTLSGALGGDKAASLYLLGRGVRGIKYRDNASRGSSGSESSYNYVIFSDKDVVVKEVSSSSDLDAEYLAAVESGDMAKAGKMVAAAATAAGYSVGPVYHGTYKPGFNVFNVPAYFAENKDYADEFSGVDVGFEGKTISIVINPGKVLDISFLGLSKISPRKMVEVLKEAGVSFNDTFLEVVSAVGTDYPFIFMRHITDIAAGYLTNAGFDSVYQKEFTSKGKSGAYIILSDSSRIKDASAVTYDDSGKIIPLSQRFNSSSKDIRSSGAETNARYTFEDVFIIEALALGKPVLTVSDCDAVSEKATEESGFTWRSTRAVWLGKHYPELVASAGLQYHCSPSDIAACKYPTAAKKEKTLYLFDFDGTLCISEGFHQNYLENPRANNPVIRILKKKLASGEAVGVLSARSKAGVISSWLSEAVGIDDISVYAIGDTSNSAKGEYIKKHFSDYDRVELYDDRKKYLDSAEDVLDESGIEFVPHDV